MVKSISVQGKTWRDESQMKETDESISLNHLKSGGWLITEFKTMLRRPKNALVKK